MQYLFTSTGLHLMEKVAHTKTLFAFDFDGTLSRIVRNPQQATLSPRLCHLLERLSSQTRTAILSGRSVRDLRRRLPFKPDYLIGNHGLEGLFASAFSLKSARQICLKWEMVIQGGFSFLPGMFLENKEFSLAVHYRHARNKKTAAKRILRFAKRLTPSPRLIPGKSVLNLVPRNAPNKGLALLKVMAESRAKKALYVGDDDTDEDVFGLSDPRIVTIRVGRKKASGARFYLRHQGEMRRLLELLVRILEK